MTTTATNHTTNALSYQDDGRTLTFTVGLQHIASYTYRPTDHQYESPRPYFHPLTTLGGDDVTISRPWDHVWHKGLSWALPNVGEHNFWGGATYTRQTGYANLDNNGAMNHEVFTSIEESADGIVASESLVWTLQPMPGSEGRALISEQRRFAIQLLPIPGSWVLLFETTMDNTSDADINIGSPTTEGRDNAGYGGLFWRGPRSFTGGEFRSEAGAGADEFMGTRSPWIAFTGQHDVTCRKSTILFVEDQANPGASNQWFARSSMFACLGSAPFFSEVVPLKVGEPLTYRYAVVISDGDVDAGAAAALADAAAVALEAWA
ncbi:PmoA family protein [Paenarthrobacter sp. NPDC018779]|uniref:PmoA family protein n=1 Tax=Paenarthrobacter sp. NPDC018779 TaxID=3364375 RepID=UPI0037CC6CB3